MSRDALELGIETLHAHFRLEGGELFWKTKHPRKRADVPAGCVSRDGYRLIRIDGVLYKAHRIIFAIKNGRWPVGILDHINGIRSDNRPENLREVTDSQSVWNTGLARTNTSGVKGVSWSKHFGKWETYVEAHGRRKKLGYFDDFDLAELVVSEARRRMHGEYVRAA
jgi:hypothetical protein